MRKLLEFGADVNAMVNLGNSAEKTNALAVAVRNGDGVAMDLLVGARADDKDRLALSAAMGGKTEAGIMGKLLGLHAHRGENHRIQKFRPDRNVLYPNPIPSELF